MRRFSISLRTMLWLANVLALAVGPTAAAAQEQDAASADRVVELTNAARQSNGMDPLTLSPQLSDAARKYSQVLASGTCFDHACGPLPNFADRIVMAGYIGWSALAENIAAGYPTAEAVVAGWMASSGHRANILSPEYTEIGVGIVIGGRLGTYWTQDFGVRSRAALTKLAAPPARDEPTADGAPNVEDP